MRAQQVINASRRFIASTIGYVNANDVHRYREELKSAIEEYEKSGPSQCPNKAAADLLPEMIAAMQSAQRDIENPGDVSPRSRSTLSMATQQMIREALDKATAVTKKEPKQ